MPDYENEQVPVTFYTNSPPASTRYATSLLNAESARRRFALARQGMRGERLKAKTDYPLPHAETGRMWQTAPPHPARVGCCVFPTGGLRRAAGGISSPPAWG